ncbi:MAG: hypothetical protein JSW23_08945 [Planctomycetota bacterium]|nr:MAG: hypothetical protein JSW23_08945 [Planctomycetota bacterium]
MMEKSKPEDKLRELVEEFGGLIDPRHKKPAVLSKQAQERHKKLQKNVDNLQESIDYLRVCIKYKLFDLEATRRENEYLKKLLGGGKS